jgi:hypothetical protein
VAVRVEARRVSCDWPEIWSQHPALVTDHKDFTQRFAGVVNALLELPRETVSTVKLWRSTRKASPPSDLLLWYGGEAAEIVLYVLALSIFRGKDVRLWPLEERRSHFLNCAATAGFNSMFGKFQYTFARSAKHSSATSAGRDSCEARG